MFDLSTEDWLEGLGEPVFFEMACENLGLSPFTAEVIFADKMIISKTEAVVTLHVAEEGKETQKVKFKVQVET